jgi:hypothetical protein
MRALVDVFFPSTRPFSNSSFGVLVAVAVAVVTVVSRIVDDSSSLSNSLIGTTTGFSLTHFVFLVVAFFAAFAVAFVVVFDFFDAFESESELMEFVPTKLFFDLAVFPSRKICAQKSE